MEIDLTLKPQTFGGRSCSSTRSQASFILGDRKLGPWVIALSERASGESAWLLVGLPGVALAFVLTWLTSEFGSELIRSLILQ